VTFFRSLCKRLSWTAGLRIDANETLRALLKLQVLESVGEDSWQKALALPRVVKRNVETKVALLALGAADVHLGRFQGMVRRQRR